MAKKPKQVSLSGNNYSIAVGKTGDALAQGNAAITVTEAEVLKGTLNTQNILHPETVVVKGDKDCPLCKGLGSHPVTPEFLKFEKKVLGGSEKVQKELAVVKNEITKTKYIPCDCMLKKEAISYLTPQYAYMDWYRNMDVTLFKNKNILFQDISVNAFRGYVKSYLLKNGCEIQHVTLSAYPMSVLYLKNVEEGGYTALDTIPFLVICLRVDTPNKLYGEIIQSLIERRKDVSQLPTWVYTEDNIYTPDFKKVYSNTLSEYLHTNLIKIPQVLHGAK